jgi:cysteine-S-conjugate beta-lyase
MSSSDDPSKPRWSGTAIVHDGRDPHANYGFINPPVYRGSTILYPTVAKLEKRDMPFPYGIYGSPTTRSLETVIANLEGAAHCQLTSSGLSAVTLGLLAFVRAGDHILMTDSVYQPTRKFCEGLLKPLGVETTYYDPLIGAGIAELFRPNTRLVFTESPGSQTFEMQDIPAIAAVARARDIWVLMDNTWAGPLYFKSFAHGVDVSIHAATKYIVGHSDALLGAVSTNERAKPFIERGFALLGVNPGSEETYLGQRGVRTIHVRMAHQWQAALEMAEWLSTRPEVERVLHPAMPSDPGHAIWKRDFLGAASLFSVLLKPVPKPAVAAMLDGLKLFGMGYSWGGYESLCVPFDPKSYRTATVWTHPGPGLRIHIGLEDTADLKDDLAAGFARMTAAATAG